MDKLSYHRHRFPSIVIQQAIWLYFRFALSYRDVEDVLAERGIDVSYETVRRWALKFGAIIARKPRSVPTARIIVNASTTSTSDARNAAPTAGAAAQGPKSTKAPFCAATSQVSKYCFSSVDQDSARTQSKQRAR